ncbi:MAG: hypothetical protein AAF928_09025 [Myxococcota bacterium]
MALPSAIRPGRFVTPVASAIDRLAAVPLRGSARQRKRRVDSVTPARRLEILERTADAYAAAHPLEDVDRFFPVAPEATTTVRERPASGRWPVLAAKGFEVVDLTWPSVMPTFVDGPEIARRFAEAEENRQGAARLFRRRRGSRRTGVVVLVHGYGGGRYAVEEQLWPVRWWLARGFDAALFTLPFHGVRRGATRFFTPDPRVTNETLRQAIIDARVLIARLRATGYDVIGAAGMSLGGYTVSLLGTIEPLSFLAPLIPLGSFADSARDGGWLNGSPADQREQYEACERAYAVIDPFARRPRVPSDHVLVMVGDGDRITPPSQGERLARHFDAPCQRFPGGHLLQAGRRSAFTALEARLPSS